MKAVILAGGMGTRIAEESGLRPKPMITIGGRPILWHIMKIYSAYGVREFVICCGYKGHLIKEYFLNYAPGHCDLTQNLKDESTCFHEKVNEPWKVTLVNTGLNTKTAGRLLKIQKYLDNEDFFLTYGDGLADVDVKKLLKFHRSHGKTATITVARPSGRFGLPDIDEKCTVTSFKEKKKKECTWVNAGFAVFTPEVFRHLGEGLQMLEDEPYESLAAARQMKAYFHPGFWAPMDTIYERDYLQRLWNAGQAPWKV